MSTNTARIDAIMNLAPVIPVLTIDDPAKAVPLATALVKGGLPVIEITLRTEGAIEAIAAVAREVEGAVPGAGTVLDAEQYKAAVDAGSQFIVSPGCTPKLADIAEGYDVPLLPGVSSASEAMALLERGYRRMKFFPAEAAGGAPFLKALSSPLSAIKFCPTGGVSLENAPSYLSLPNVICVGGSWIASKKDVAEENWFAIESRARQAAELHR